MLGDTSKLNLCGDGSALPSGANTLTASRLVNAIRTVYTNAITIDTILMLLLTGDMILTVNATTSDILTTSTSSITMDTTYPCTSALHRLRETDYTQSMKDFDRLKKTLKEHGLHWEDKAILSMMLVMTLQATMNISWMMTLLLS